MHKVITHVIGNWPFKLLFIITIGIVAAMAGVSQIELSTGNETLIEEDTDVYLDNLKYQQTFGADPILIVFEEPTQADLLNLDSMNTYYELDKKISQLEGVFFVSSPINIIEEIGAKQKEYYEEGLTTLGDALVELSYTLGSKEIEGMDFEQLSETFINLSDGQSSIGSNTETMATQKESLIVLLEAEMQELTTEIQTLQQANDLSGVQDKQQTYQVLMQVDQVLKQSLILDSNVIAGTEQTATALNKMLTEFAGLQSSLTEMESQFQELSDGLYEMGTTLQTLGENFNLFEPSIPTSEETLTNMVYQDGSVNPMMEQFLIDDTHMFMSIVLEEGTSTDEIEVIVNSINEMIDPEQFDDVLISGKPVLDYDIQASMMDSMKIMMITSGVIMVVVLTLLFNVKLKYMPLLIVLMAVVVTVGVMGWVSVPLTMVSMAVFPVLIGLGIDYSIQFHSRYSEELNKNSYGGEPNA